MSLNVRQGYFNQNYYYSVKNNNPLSFCSYRNIEKKENPVSFKEGLILVGKGIKDKAVGIVKSIIQHPVRTVATIGLSTAALAALPFFGISMATGGALMVVGFGGLAIFNTAKNLYKARKNNKNGNFNDVRNNLQNLGGNIVDLAMTLPFMPKAIKHLKRNIPLYIKNTSTIVHNPDGSGYSKIKNYYGGKSIEEYAKDGTFKGITYKDSLFSKMKRAKTWKERYSLLTSQDRKEAMFEQINKAYKQVAKDRGIDSARDVRFMANTDEMTGKISIENNEILIKEISKYKAKNGYVHAGMDSFDANLVNAKANGRTPDNIIKTIGHEHRHVEQHEMIARAEGLVDKNSNYAQAFSADAIRKGVIKKGTPEWQMAKDFLDARKNYVSGTQNYEAYRKNLLEVDARNVGETEIANQIMVKLKSNMGIDAAKKLSFDSAKYNPSKDIIIVNGLPIVKQAE